jgi:hypothetical protein
MAHIISHKWRELIMSKRKKAGIPKPEKMAIGDAIFSVFNFRDVLSGDKSLERQMGQVLLDLRTDPEIDPAYFHAAADQPGDPLHDLIYMRSSKIFGRNEGVHGNGKSLRSTMHAALKRLLVQPEHTTL